MKEHNIILKWGISKGKDTYGYNVLTARDANSRKKITDAAGGGYDITNTVLCDVLATLYQVDIDEAYARLSPWQQKDSFRHLQRDLKTGRTVVDGAVGDQVTNQLLSLLGLTMGRVKIDSKTTVVNLRPKVGSGVDQ